MTLYSLTSAVLVSWADFVLTPSVTSSGWRGGSVLTEGELVLEEGELCLGGWGAMKILKRFADQLQLGDLVLARKARAGKSECKGLHSSVRRFSPGR